MICKKYINRIKQISCAVFVTTVKYKRNNLRTFVIRKWTTTIRIEWHKDSGFTLFFEFSRHPERESRMHEIELNLNEKSTLPNVNEINRKAKSSHAIQIWSFVTNRIDILYILEWEEGIRHTENTSKIHKTYAIGYNRL